MATAGHSTRRTKLLVCVTSVAIAALVAAGLNAARSSRATAAPENVPALLRQLRPLLEAQMKENGTPGAIVLVDVPGKGTWETSIGTADLSTHAPMDHAFYTRIGSVTKTFTAETILRLVDERQAQPR